MCGVGPTVYGPTYVTVKPSEDVAVGVAKVTPAWTVAHSSPGRSDQDVRFESMLVNVTLPKFANGSRADVTELATSSAIPSAVWAPA